MASSEGRYEVNLACQDASIWVFSSCSDGPIDESLKARTVKTRQMFFEDDSAVDGGALSRPLVTLVVGETLLVDDFSCFVDCVLILDVHWSE